MMIEENKAIARTWFEEVMTKRNLAAIDEAYSADYVYRGADGSQSHGREEAKAIAKSLVEAVPDRISVVEQQVAEGDLVTTRWVSRGTQTGPLMGAPATNAPVTVRGITISRLRGGQIVEDWEIIHVAHG